MTRFIYLSNYNGESVVTEPGLEDCEQETAFYFSTRTAKKDFIQVSSNNAPIVRGLLEHPAYEHDEIVAIGSESAPRVIYTAGRLPINCLRITQSKGSMSLGKIITETARQRISGRSTWSSTETPVEAPVGSEQEMVV